MPKSTITLSTNEIAAFHPCGSGIRKLLKSLGKTCYDDEQFPLLKVLESNGVEDTIWCFRVHWLRDKEVYMQFVRECADRAGAYRNVAATYGYAADGYSAYSAPAISSAIAAVAADAATAADADAAYAAYAAIVAAADASVAAVAAVAEAAADAAVVSDAAVASERNKQYAHLRELLS
jgi:hypothetical protein